MTTPEPGTIPDLTDPEQLRAALDNALAHAARHPNYPRRPADDVAVDAYARDVTADVLLPLVSLAAQQRAAKALAVLDVAPVLAAVVDEPAEDDRLTQAWQTLAALVIRYGTHDPDQIDTVVLTIPREVLADVDPDRPGARLTTSSWRDAETIRVEYYRGAL